jgi:hypothetical protein
MAWPFSTVQPSRDSGFVAVPVAAAAPAGWDLVTASWVMGANFANGSDSEVFIFLADGAGNLIFPGIRLAARDAKPYEWPFMPTTGLQWWTNAPPNVVTGKVWGY